MAMTINSSPILTGDSALFFNEEAQRNAELPTPSLSHQKELEIKEFLKRSNDIHFPPEN